jgi:hypothetical protein
MLKPTLRPSKLNYSLIALGLIVLLGQGVTTVLSQTAYAEKYQSRLNSLILKKNDVYLPTRMVIGEDVHFVVKAPVGSHVKLLLSAQNSGYQLPNGQTLRVGTESQELSGIVPENGVLQLKMTMPKDADMEGKTIYVDAAAGPTDDDLAPMELVDATGRRTANNALAIVKPSEAGSMSIMPNMPGMSPQMMGQLTNMSNMQGNPNAKQLIDNGDINQSRANDRNPFAYRGSQPGLMVGH